MKNNKLTQVFLEAENFSDRIKEKYGVKLGMYLTENLRTHTISLKQLYHLVELAVEQNHPEEVKNFNFKTTRRRVIMNYQHAFCSIAWEMLGYKKITIGEFLDKNHATVINSIRNADSFLSVNDVEFRIIYDSILKKLEEHVGFISKNTENDVNTKPVLSFIQSEK